MTVSEFAKEYKVVALRDCPQAKTTDTLTSSEDAARYWVKNIETDPNFRPEQEQLYVVMVNTHGGVIGHVLIGLGSNSTVVGAGREIFRAAIIGAADGIVMMHNHPSGGLEPSKNDMQQAISAKVAGAMLGIDVQDSIVMGVHGRFKSVFDWMGKNMLPKDMGTVMKGMGEDMEREAA